MLWVCAGPHTCTTTNSCQQMNTSNNGTHPPSFDSVVFSLVFFVWRIFHTPPAKIADINCSHAFGSTNIPPCPGGVLIMQRQGQNSKGTRLGGGCCPPRCLCASVLCTHHTSEQRHALAIAHLGCMVAHLHRTGTLACFYCLCLQWPALARVRLRMQLASFRAFCGRRAMTS